MRSWTNRIFVIVAALAINGSVLHAQATRTWVSGVGDDANPCSRTAPCKTFAGAISKTATGGEINVLDPGGFGGVTITKSITISSEGFEAGVLVSGTNAIIVNAGNTGIVVLRGLDFEGLGTGLSGIRVLSAGSVHVENCTINRFTQFGIDFAPTSVTTHTAQLHVSNSIIRNNAGINSGGIRIKPGVNVSAVGMIENTQLRNSNVGLRVEDNSRVTAKDTTAAGNTTAGFLAVGSALASTLNLDDCAAIGNVNGVKADLGLATIRVSDCMVAGNTTGFNTSAGGHIATFGDVMNADANNGVIDADIPKQ
ncbi:MAG TPA: right-handed parallel beta-helix repeat-containing protein [Thermoanaerobaculia bacterium]|nr:right-handed parallel beta-helix repeat-containing protein [Thermoanaerobaculia bacterium]